MKIFFSALAAFAAILTALPAHAAWGMPFADADVAAVGLAIALVLSELLPFLPVSANGLLHATLLLLRSIFENIKPS